MKTAYFTRVTDHYTLVWLNPKVIAHYLKKGLTKKQAIAKEATPYARGHFKFKTREEAEAKAAQEHPGFTHVVFREGAELLSPSDEFCINGNSLREWIHVRPPENYAKPCVEVYKVKFEPSGTQKTLTSWDDSDGGEYYNQFDPSREKRERVSVYIAKTVERVA